MKKSGTRPSCRPTSGGSVGLLDIAIAPKADEITVQILAERHHLRLEASAQFTHQLLVSRAGIGKDHPALRGIERLTAQPSGSESLDGLLDGQRAWAPADRERVEIGNTS